MKKTLPNYMDVKEGETLISYNKGNRLSKIEPHGYHSVSNPIPQHHLKSILDELIPKSVSKKERAIWDRRISVTLKAYEAYVRAVCGSFHSTSEGGIETALRWEEFKSKLGSSSEKDFNYSLHH